jgi:hypothetical protein
MDRWFRQSSGTNINAASFPATLELWYKEAAHMSSKCALPYISLSLAGRLEEDVCFGASLDGLVLYPGRASQVYQAKHPQQARKAFAAAAAAQGKNNNCSNQL